MKELKIAWVYPMSGLAFYLQPVLREFTRLFPKTKLFTGKWPGYVPGCEEAFDVELVGKTRYIDLSRKKTGYGRGLHILSPNIIPKLLRFKPDVVFVNGLNLWTLSIVLLQPLTKWRIVLVYSGSSPNVDMTDAKARLFVRRLMVRSIHAAITNSQAGKDYLTKILGVKLDRVFAGPYQMPDKAALQQPNEAARDHFSKLQSPIFLFVGQTISRKGIDCLLESCKQLDEDKPYSVLIIGDGQQRSELEQQTQKLGLAEKIKWLGWIEYGKLGSYIEQIDVFVFPTLEDIWGMVVLENMLFEKPILCSTLAGAKEMIEHGKNGFIFDPNNPAELASYMEKFIDNLELANSMGKHSKQLIEPHNPSAIALKLSNIVKSL